jgi:EAL and modified HD-GYP domain-containing signal transduction protein
MIARQPIFDKKTVVYGYELLFRSCGENRYVCADPRMASAHTMSRALSSFGLPSLLGSPGFTSGVRAFFNFTLELIIDEMYLALPKERCVVEVLETTLASPDALHACRKMRAAGYQLALDDVVEPSSEGGLLELADYIKLDFRSIPPERRASVIARVRPLGSRIIAEKVETKHEFVMAMEHGCDLVQGYFFCEPELVSGRALSGCDSIYLDFLRELNRPQLKFDVLERIIKRDATLCIKLLQYLNSAAVGMRHTITSIQHALVLLGEKAIQKWGTLVALTNVGRRQSSEVLIASLARAHFCERVAAAEGWRDREFDMFLVGLLSMIDAVLGVTMEVVLQQIGLPDRVKAVLLADGSAPREMAQVCSLAKACERGAWGAVIKLSTGLRTTQSELAMHFYDALSWADQAMPTCAA